MTNDMLHCSVVTVNTALVFSFQDIKYDFIYILVGRPFVFV